MQKLSLNQSLQQKLSPQQIQFIKLLQIPTAELEARIEEELEINPALEEGLDEVESMDIENSYDESDYDDEGYDSKEPLNLEDYLHHDEYAGYKMHSDGTYQDEDSERPIATISTLHDSLVQQFGFLRLTDRERVVGMELLGNIENDGYIRRSLQAIVNDLIFTRNFTATIDELEAVLKKIQRFEPAGIGARNLKECLLLQLDRRDIGDYNVQCACKIIQNYFDEFSKKHFDKIQKRMSISQEQMKCVISLITKLNPKPGSVEGEDGLAHYLVPDFSVINNNGRLDVHLHSKNAPELHISRSFAEMLDAYDRSDKSNRHVRETISFVKQKLDSAKWFIDAIKQRQNTLQRTMKAIVEYQQEFFFEGEEKLLKPMILKDIAMRIDMDVSTVSRVANSKAVQTEFGIFPLKFFFSEGISTEFGEEASSREVKSIMKNLIDNESKKSPLSDEKLEALLNEQGYNIARRTVAKYREQLNIPVARLRKQL